ncbi:MAG: hypothetical protein IJ565_05870 [Bacilli bacterium]|nr:hypothetical protein [Bacilli bacterium]
MYQETMISDVLFNKTNDKLKKFLSIFHCIIIGGAIRDILSDACPRDFDIIIDEENTSKLEEFIKEQNVLYGKNFFGGYKLYFDDAVCDVWLLKNHFLFKEGVYDICFDNISKTTLINYDSLVYDVKEGKLDINNYCDCIEKNEIDFIGDEKAKELNYNPILSVIKILSLKNKGFKISDRVSDYIKECYYKNEDDFIKLIRNEYIRHYHMNMPLPLEEYIISSISTQKTLVKH